METMSYDHDREQERISHPENFCDHSEVQVTGEQPYRIAMCLKCGEQWDDEDISPFDFFDPEIETRGGAYYED